MQIQIFSKVFNESSYNYYTISTAIRTAVSSKRKWPWLVTAWWATDESKVH